MDNATATLIILLSLVIYFLPTLIARGHAHSKTTSIFVVNLFLGWTLIGWVVALSWSFSENNDTDDIEEPEKEEENINENDVYWEIERLSSLKEKGIITEEEFTLKKKQLLGL